MAWTTPVTHLVGDFIDAPAWNSEVTGNMNALRANYATTLPVSPSDGDQAILVDSTTSPTYQWLFRYNASNSTAYKWEFIGGSKLSGYVDAGGTTASTTYVEVGSTLTLTLPRAGIYTVDHGCYTDGPEAYASFASFTIGAAAPSDSNGIQWYGSGTSGSKAVVGVQITAAASDTLIYKVKIGGGAAATFAKKGMTVTPVRVS